MDGIGRYFSKPVPVTIGGGFFLCRAFTLAGFAAAETYQLLGRKTLAQAVADVGEGLRVPRDVHDWWYKIHQDAVAQLRRDKDLRVVTYEQQMAWLNTRRGLNFCAWWCLSRGRRRFGSPDAAGRWMHRHAGAEKDFLRVRNVVSGFDEMAMTDRPFQLSRHPRTGKTLAELGGAKYIPWRKFFSTFARELGVMPDAIGRLTLWALDAVTTDPEQFAAGGAVSVSAEEAKALAKLTPDERKQRLQLR